MNSFFDDLNIEFKKICTNHNLLNERINIKARALEVEEAIGNPDGKDFPIQKGKEKLMQAEFKSGKGQAFTDMFHNYEGTLSEIIDMPKKTNYERAVFISSLNAVLNHLGLVNNTVHCKDNDPYTCAAELSNFIKKNHENKKICLIGFQPAFIKQLSDKFNLRVVDLDPDNLGKKINNVVVEGEETSSEAVLWADILLVTGTVLANNTINDFPLEKTIFYGTTIAGAAEIKKLKRFCCMST